MLTKPLCRIVCFLAFCFLLMPVLAGSGSVPGELIDMTAHAPPAPDGTPGELLATFTVDTGKNVVAIHIEDAVAARGGIARIHGFAPEGWAAECLMEIPLNGVQDETWNYTGSQELNILGGLAYLTVQEPAANTPVRGQIVSTQPMEVTFPQVLSVVDTAGTCHLSMQLFDVLDKVEVDMEPAQVQIIRGLPRDGQNQPNREIPLGITVRVGGGYAPGMGHFEAEMLGDYNPGLVTAQSPDQDFPAQMTFSLRKRYITPFGTFLTEKEEYLAPVITRFPPWGVELMPTQERVRLLDEVTGEHVGYLYPGAIVPLFYAESPMFKPARDLPFLTEDVREGKGKISAKRK